MKEQSKIETNQLETKREIARACRMSERSIENLMARRVIPFIKVGRSVRFEREKVLEALRGFEVTTK